MELSTLAPDEVQECNSDDNSVHTAFAAAPSVSGLFSGAERLDWFLIFFGSVGSCVHGAALPVFFVLFGRLINSLGSLSNDLQSFSSEVSKNALYLVYLGLLVMASSWIGVSCWMQTGERQASSLRVKYMQSVLKQEIHLFDADAKNNNILYHISSDAVLVHDAIGDKIGHCLRYISQFLVGFIVGFSSVWQLTLLTLAIVPLMVIAGGIYTVTISGLSKKGEAAYAEAGKIADEVISQIRTVHSYVGEERSLGAYSRSIKKALEFGKKSGLAKGLGVGTTYGLLFCAWSLLLWYAGVLVRHKVTNGAKAFTTILNVIFSGFALGQAAPNINSFAKGQAAASNIISMINDMSSASNTSDKGIVLQKISGNIDFCKVSFSYPSRNNLVLEELNLLILAGRTHAVVGQSGSGKSTIISLIERFYEPTSGEILLDGYNMKKLQLKWLRSQMGLVSQEPALFSTSIAENILYGKEDAVMEEIIEAAKVANAHSFIQTLPDGYKTEVGEGGTQLSGGQKQRIAIARAVIRNPKILLLDEATSALDAESECHVQQALERVMINRTTVVVAHRLSTISNVNLIAVIKNGRIIESGTHTELMSKGENGEYAMLVRLQLSSSSQNLSEDITKGQKTYTETSTYLDIPVNKDDKGSSKSVVIRDNKKITELDSIESKRMPSIWKFLKLNKPEWPYGVMGSVGAILAGIEGPLFALGITHILDILYTYDNVKIRHEIKVVSLIFIAAAIGTVPIYLLQHYFYTLMGEKLTSRVRLLMFSAILKNEIGWFDLEDNNSGFLTSSLAADATLVRSALADRMSTIVQNVALTVTAFVIAFVLCWRMAFVVVATLPLIIGASIAEHLFLKGFGGNYTHAYARATSVVREAITNIRTVAAFGAEDRISAHFISELNEPKKQATLRGHISGIGFGLSQLFVFCSYALSLWYASQLIKHGNSNFGNIMKSFMVLIITALGIAETLSMAPDIVKGSQALGSVFSILERRTRINPDDRNSEMVAEINGDIEFRNVSFRYPTRPEVTILDDMNLKVVAGTSFAIVGRSGSGKSSVIALIMRFYDPSHGSILIDNKNIRNLNLKSLRLKIGLVQQEPALFSTTIYENIAYGKEGASEIEVMKAAKAANAHGFISRMPEGYNTSIGERGSQLSGGQKQRLAIARAVLKDPSILLLDEATSALDTASEKLVQEALHRLMEGRTTVVVAHRLSTIRDANMIVVLQRGKVEETGRHCDLLKKPTSLYSQLVQLHQQSCVFGM
ncbi:Xenobiotic-transporting ATPase protein [Dioscorea alata]|uniref:Xenobiotic-transporting ATPase protein n=1 Tax=Dioscorea alata TaxID=55571 RepID=A0ACB7TYK9_DIOAL|nr:Xenobiotic-transporting ATPase protein [Dioscorea alata]